VNVLLRNPRRELAIDGPMSVVKLLNRLDLNRESVLVISEGTLVPGDAILADDVSVEIRPVISGGQGHRGVAR
jgi:sulfur carrier protein